MLRVLLLLRLSELLFDYRKLLTCSKDPDRLNVEARCIAVKPHSVPAIYTAENGVWRITAVIPVVLSIGTKDCWVISHFWFPGHLKIFGRSIRQGYYKRKSCFDCITT